jgi:hypothetical protein
MAMATAAAAPLVVDVHPIDCGATSDSHGAISAAVQRCRAHGRVCSVILAPGCVPTIVSVARPTPVPTRIIIFTPGSIDLSNTTGITFGGATGVAASGRPRLDADYEGQGCPAVDAIDATNVATVQHIVMDTTRLPFMQAVALSTTLSSPICCTVSRESAGA